MQLENKQNNFEDETFLDIKKEFGKLIVTMLPKILKTLHQLAVIVISDQCIRQIFGKENLI